MEERMTLTISGFLPTLLANSPRGSFFSIFDFDELGHIAARAPSIFFGDFV